ncbi:MAG: hypothetical protein VCA36_06365 [Opitutales bacterium]
MRHRKLNFILLASSLMLSAGVVHARYLMPTMDRVLSASSSIADVTVASFDKHGNARLTINEELKGKQPGLVTGVSLSCYPIRPRNTGMKVGQRYLVMCRNDLLYEESTQYEIRVRDGVVECLFPQGNGIRGEGRWTPLKDIRKRISHLGPRKG